MLHYHLHLIRNYVSFSVSSQNSTLNIENNSWDLEKVFPVTERQMESARRVINLKLHMSLLSSVDEQLSQGALWYPVGAHL